MVVEIWEGTRIRIIHFYNPRERLKKDTLESIGGDRKQKWYGVVILMLTVRFGEVQKEI